MSAHHLDGLASPNHAVHGLSHARYLMYVAAVSGCLDDAQAPLMPVYRARVVADIVQRAYEWVVVFQHAQQLEPEAQALLLNDLFRRVFPPGRVLTPQGRALTLPVTVGGSDGTPRGAAMKVLLNALRAGCADLEMAAAARTTAFVRKSEALEAIEAVDGLGAPTSAAAGPPAVPPARATWTAR